MSTLTPKPSNMPEADKNRITSAGIPAELIQQQLDRILQSTSFAQSQRLIRFLRFIVEQHLKNEADQLKEYHLGVSVFDRSESYDPRTDPIVRVEASRLRAKLREYYDSEGINDPILIEIPKGSYAPAVVRRPTGEIKALEPPRQKPQPRRYLLLVLALTTIVSVAAASYLYWRYRETSQELQSRIRTGGLAHEFLPIWGRFLTPSVQTHIVFGSPMFFASPDHSLFLRPYGIKEAEGLESNPTFQQLRQRFGTLTGPRYDYALLGEVLAVQRLTEFLARNGVSVNALPSYKTTWDAIQSGHIILLGAPRMNHLLRHFPRRLDFEWDPDEVIRNRAPQPGESEVYTAQFHEGFSDRQPDALLNAHTYAIVACLPGLRPNRHILLVSVHGGPGLWEAVDYLTRPETLRPLLQRLQLPDSREPVAFQMLLRIYVDRGIPVRTEYVTHHTVPEGSNSGSRRSF